MSKEDYESKIETIKAIPEDQMKSPNMPVDVYLQEAENQFTWAQEDKDELTGAGLDWRFVEELPVRAGTLREAENLSGLKNVMEENKPKETGMKKSPKLMSCGIIYYTVCVMLFVIIMTCCSELLILLTVVGMLI